MADSTSSDQGTEAAVKSAVAPLVITASATIAGALIAGGIAMLIGTNYKSSTLTGDTEIHPTSDETAISKAETAAQETEGKLSQDKVAGTNGDVKANETAARASTAEATAADSGASAVRTKAGATDIETKALKMT
jgi:hypothetical protein